MSRNSATSWRSTATSRSGSRAAMRAMSPSALSRRHAKARSRSASLSCASTSARTARSAVSAAVQSACRRAIRVSAVDGIAAQVEPAGRPPQASRGRPLPHLLELDLADAGGDVQADAALDADRLQGDLAAAAAHQDIGAGAHADGGRCRRPDKRARGRAGPVVPWCETQPDVLGFLVEAKMDAVFVGGPLIG